MSRPVAFYEDKPIPPARRAAAAALEIVQRATLELSSLPFRVDRGPIVEVLGRALVELTLLEASEVDDPDHLDRLARAVETLNESQGLLARVDGDVARALATALSGSSRALADLRGRTLDVVVARQSALSRAPSRSAAPEEPPRLRASPRGEPAVHPIHAPALLASLLRVAPDEAELLADPDAAEVLIEALPRPRRRASLDAPGAEGELAQLAGLARDLLEEVGALGLLRVARDNEGWSRGFARFEERLVRSLDALLALGQEVASTDGATVTLDLFGELAAYAADGLTLDPARAFARAFVLSCVEGEEGVRQALLALRQSHPSLYSAQRDALLLGSSPAIGPALRRLCVEGTTDLTCLALDVLHARREARIEVLWPLLEHPDPGIRRRAAQSLATVPERGPALQALSQMLEDEDERVVVAAAEGLLCLRAPLGLDAARRLLRAELEDPGRLDPFARLEVIELLGVAGDAPDARLLEACLERRPREAEALGWHGHPALVEPLLTALERSAFVSGKSLFCAAVARALHRITGAHPRDGHGELSIDPAQWRALWLERGGRFDVSQRYRFGRPYTLAESLDEIDTEGTPTRDRERCALEVRIGTGGAACLEVRGWAARLDHEIAELRRSVDGGRSTRDEHGRLHAPGEWLTTRFRKH